jgi:hypothetical protein
VNLKKALLTIILVKVGKPTVSPTTPSLLSWCEGRLSKPKKQHQTQEDQDEDEYRLNTIMFS